MDHHMLSLLILPLYVCFSISAGCAVTVHTRNVISHVVSDIGSCVQTHSKKKKLMRVFYVGITTYCVTMVTVFACGPISDYVCNLVMVTIATRVPGMAGVI